MKIFTAVVFLFICSLASAFTKKYVVTVDELNVRSSPSIEGTKIDTLHLNDTIEVYQILDGWARFDIEKEVTIVAYASAEFLEEIHETAPKEEKDERAWWQKNFFLIIGVVIGLYIVGKFILSIRDSRKWAKTITPNNSESSSTRSRTSYVKKETNAVDKVKPIIQESLKEKEEVCICKYCGTVEHNGLWKLTVKNCSYSPTKKHVPFNGGIMDNYICQYCGTKHENLHKLVVTKCSDSPTGKHVPFDKGVQSSYTCKHCGTKHADLWKLTRGKCAKSPTGKHEPQ